MATVTSVQLSPLTPMSADPTKVEATVDYTVLFEASEAGQTHRITVQLCGEDLAGDDEPLPSPLAPPKVLHTFTFGLGAFKLISAPSGQLTDTVKAVIAFSKLNEDPSVEKIQLPGGNTLAIKHSDEVYARVTVSRVHEARSATQQILI